MTEPQTARGQARHGQYSPDQERPLREYAGLMAVYAGLVALLGLAARRTHRLPDSITVGDVALGGVAVHKASRILARDPITSPIRAPFTRLEGVNGPAELRERVRGGGWRRAVGEMLTCPFCLGQWLATLYVFGLAFAPRLTRALAATFAIHAGSDALQVAYTRLENGAD
jgi:hypothetical protein